MSFAYKLNNYCTSGQNTEVVPEKLRVCLINAQSIVSKLNLARVVFRDKFYHMIAVTETWLKQSIHSNKSIELNGYNILRCDRPRKKGGGVALFIRSDFLKTYKPKLVSKCITPNLEHLVVNFLLNGENIALGVGYIPKHGLPLNDLETLLTNLSQNYSKVIFLGDLNIDYLNLKESYNLRLILNTCDLSSIQTVPTRTTDSSAKLIDYIISNIPNRTSINRQFQFSDHDLVGAEFDFEVSPAGEYYNY